MDGTISLRKNAKGGVRGHAPGATFFDKNDRIDRCEKQRRVLENYTKRAEDKNPRQNEYYQASADVAEA